MILVEENDARFYLKESNIKNAGLGVFAKEDIKKDNFLEIIGVMVNINSLSDICTNYAKDYKFAANFENKFDRHIIPMGFGGMVNHTEDKNLQNVELRYLRHSISNSAAGSAVYYFIKDVKKDEEIFFN